MADIIDIGTDHALALAKACAVLAEGEPIAMPTETVYGLAADATNPDAIARIYEVKGRPRLIRAALIRNGETTVLLPDGKAVK